MQQAEPIDAAALCEAGVAALRGGDAAAAREHFEAIAAAGRANAYHWSCLALACKALRDSAGMLAACDRALAADPRNLSALILKGDHLAAEGDARAATQFYALVVAIASQAGRLPEALDREVRRVAAARERINADIAAHLAAELASQGYDRATASARFSQSLDILSGRKQPYFQSPRAYFFPELPQIQFHARAAFPWLAALEAETGAILAELLEVMRGDGPFVPYVRRDHGAPVRNDHKLLDSADWSAFYLCKDGEIVGENAARCPATMAALDGVPLARIRNRGPSILFSRLLPGARIEPHTGFLNTRLICHLPLIVPPGCGLRVGNDVREWQKGRAWVFDDTIEHEAWNAGSEARVILIFDVWRPDLTDEERRLVTALLEAVDSYRGRVPS